LKKGLTSFGVAIFGAALWLIALASSAGAQTSHAGSELADHCVHIDLIMICVST
jgi:hypothetical protein